MFQTGLAGQILFLLMIGFSLLIVVVNQGFNRQKGPLFWSGPLFLSPLVVFTFLYLFPPGANAEALFISSETALLTGILLVMLVPTRLFPVRAFTLAAYMMPLVLISISYLPVFSLWPHLDRWLLYTNMGLSSLALFQSRRHFTAGPAYTLGLLFLLAAQPIALQSDSLLSRAVYVALHGLSLGSFFIYYYRSIHSHLSHSIDEANRRLAEWEKSVKYEVLKRTIDFEHTHQRLLDINKTDGLTNCLNKNAIVEEIDKLVQGKQNFTILMADIDKFKEINDTQGHLVGDQILAQVSAVVQRSIRGVDCLGRYGGDEFIVTLPRTGIRDAFYVAERIRKNISGHPELDITLSIGAASYPEDGDSTAQLIEVADKGLYLSKQRGRNTISYATEIQ